MAVRACARAQGVGEVERQGSEITGDVWGYIAVAHFLCRNAEVSCWYSILNQAGPHWVFHPEDGMGWHFFRVSRLRCSMYENI